MEIEKLKFKRKLSRNEHSVTIAVPKLLLELMNAEKCEFAYVSIENGNSLKLEVIRNAKN